MQARISKEKDYVSIHSRPIRRLTPQPTDRGRADCPSLQGGGTEKDFIGFAVVSTPLFPMKGEVSNHKGIFDENFPSRPALRALQTAPDTRCGRGQTACNAPARLPSLSLRPASMRRTPGKADISHEAPGLCCRTVLMALCEACGSAPAASKGSPCSTRAKDSMYPRLARLILCAAKPHKGSAPRDIASAPRPLHAALPCGGKCRSIACRVRASGGQ